MSLTTYVIVPFGYGMHRFSLAKAKPWGPIEKILLGYIAKTPCTSTFLAKTSNLPRQLVVEMLIPLMKAGWIEIKPINDEYFFVTTNRGAEVALYEELPTDSIPYSRVRSFMVDPLTRECYRYEKRKKKQSFQLYSKHNIFDATKSFRGLCSELNIISSYTTTLSRIYEKITNYDE
ncbi:TPA: hypothetical protein ACIAOO_004531, partial [Salmonella enterica subsp. diarizonae serovar 48:k:-]